MKILRLAMFTLTPPPKDWDRWTMNVGDVSIETIPFRNAPAVHNALRVPVVAGRTLTTLPVPDGEGLVEIPESERRDCEHALEVSANIISVLAKAGRQVTTLWPPVAFLPETHEDRVYLDTVRGIRYQHRVYVGTTSPIPLTEELLRSLTDRLDGLGSLATFFSTDNALGRYREAARFLEMAFGLSATGLDKKLAQFLASGRFGYTRTEVRSWLLHRHGAVHGDGKRTTSVTWESDVRPFLQRIEQALLDVLFNKAVWHSSSHARRFVWTAAFGTPSASKGVFVTRGSEGALEFQMLDAWGTFPMDLTSLTPPPANWWCKLVESPS